MRFGASGAIALACTVLSAAPAPAQTENLFPAPECAAFWGAYQAVQTRYAITEPPDGWAAQAAAGFRAVALRLAGGDTARVEREIAREYPVMVDMLEAYQIDGDATARDMFLRLTRICGEFAARHPETQAFQ